MKIRLDQRLEQLGLVASRSQAESYIKLGKVRVNKEVVTKPGTHVTPAAEVELMATEQYVSRAALKLASVAAVFGLDFRGATVLDVGSSTGGFTDYALQHGAERVIAVEAGRGQLHSSLRDNPKIELHEQTDIRDVQSLSGLADIVVIDVSFVSLREILPHVAKLGSPQTKIVAMVKPQFEATVSKVKHKGVIKNDRLRREIFKQFESWARERFVIVDKADSAVAGAKGNLERFYLLRKA